MLAMSVAIGMMKYMCMSFNANPDKEEALHGNGVPYDINCANMFLGK